MKKSDVDKEMDDAMDAAGLAVAATEVATEITYAAEPDLEPIKVLGHLEVTELDSEDTILIESIVDARLEAFFKGEHLKGGIKDELRKDLQEVAYSLREFIKKEVEKLKHQIKTDFMEELRRL